MPKANVNGTVLAYEDSAAGEPVVLLHPGFVANSFAALRREPALRSYRLVSYQRRGYGESASAQPPLSIEQQAADCAALMDALGIAQAHIVGHSFGADIGLQLARAYAPRVHSLTLLEPPLMFPLSPVSTQAMQSAIGQAMGLAAGGQIAEATDTWLTGAFGPDWQAVVNRNVPGGVAQAVRDGATAMAIEGASLQGWAYGPEDLRRIKQPALAVVHVDTRFPMFDEVQKALVDSIPDVESMVVPNVTHLMEIQDPRAVAEGLAGFFARHPMPVG